ncbi:MAG: dihydrolipoamide acetyltransferase family protein [Acidobacteriota bacterium]
MVFEFKFPDVGEGIHEGRIVEWLVKAGDSLKVDQPFVKVETDKAVVDLPSPRAGTVLELRFGKGDVIHVGDVIAVFGTEGEAKAHAPALPEAVSSAAAADAFAPSAPPPSAPRPGRVLATPHTRALARKLGVDLASVPATGRNGRVTDEDLRRFAEAPPPAPSAFRVRVDGAKHAPPTGPAAPLGEADSDPYGPVERAPVSHLRKVIAQAMALSKRTAAHVTHVDEADVTDLLALYGRLKPLAEADGVKLGLTAFFVKALASVLKAHPLLNASYDEAREEIVYKKYVHMGVAVDTPEGLIVPVVRDADRKDLLTVAREVADLAARARERRLSLDELKGASFTLTNIGPVGGLIATPIIHQPELAIAAFFAVKDRPAVHEGKVAVRKMMNVALSFDHRIIDGAEGARAASALVQRLEHPEYMLLRG